MCHVIWSEHAKLYLVRYEANSKFCVMTLHRLTRQPDGQRLVDRTTDQSMDGIRSKHAVDEQANFE